MKKCFVLFLMIMVLCLLTGCSAAKKETSSGMLGDYEGGYIKDIDSIPDIPEKGEEDDVPSEIGGNGYEYKPGQLTVCAYNDNEYYDYYRSLIDQQGLFSEYQEKFKLNNNRVSLSFKNANNVMVELLEDGKTVYTSYTDANGKCYLFNKTESEKYNIRVTYDEGLESVSKEFEVSDNDEIDLEIDKIVNNTIQLMFVVDTTGSMGDEIEFLKAEIKNVFETIKNDNKDANVYLALMFYRDKGDKYVTKYFDFTKDIDLQVSNLSKESAGGGGDFPEAVQDAFSLACTKQWLSSNSTKILIHVADAPSHDSDVNSWFESVKSLSSMGVRIINVASSGIDKKTEYLFRNECFMTNGYYCYLTDDSGIGDSHLQATVYEKPTVEYLNACLIRLINGMHTGDMKEAIYYKQTEK